MHRVISLNIARARARVRLLRSTTNRLSGSQRAGVSVDLSAPRDEVPSLEIKVLPRKNSGTARPTMSNQAIVQR